MGQRKIQKRKVQKRKVVEKKMAGKKSAEPLVGVENPSSSNDPSQSDASSNSNPSSNDMSYIFSKRPPPAVKSKDHSEETPEFTAVGEANVFIISSQHGNYLVDCGLDDKVAKYSTCCLAKHKPPAGPSSADSTKRPLSRKKTKTKEKTAGSSTCEESASECQCFQVYGLADFLRYTIIYRFIHKIGGLSQRLKTDQSPKTEYKAVIVTSGKQCRWNLLPFLFFEKGDWEAGNFAPEVFVRSLIFNGNPQLYPPEFHGFLKKLLQCFETDETSIAVYFTAYSSPITSAEQLDALDTLPVLPKLYYEAVSKISKMSTYASARSSTELYQLPFEQFLSIEEENIRIMFPVLNSLHRVKSGNKWLSPSCPDFDPTYVNAADALMVLVQVKDKKILFLGDSRSETLEDAHETMQKKGNPLNCDILSTLSYHVTRSLEFIRKCSPAVVVVSFPSGAWIKASDLESLLSFVTGKSERRHKILSNPASHFMEDVPEASLISSLVFTSHQSLTIIFSNTTRIHQDQRVLSWKVRDCDEDPSDSDCPQCEHQKKRRHIPCCLR